MQTLPLTMRAAEAGDLDAQYNLGDCYRLGTGTAVDPQKAVEWYTKAAEGGHLTAQYSLGVCYRLGTGTAVDPQKAVEWYTKAAEGGDFVAQDYMRNHFPSHVTITAMGIETSGNETMDKLIQDTPFLDWIPYKRFQNIV